MREIREDVQRWLARGDRVALATVVATRRSAPRPVGAKLAIYRIMDELAANGIGVVLISSELPEIMGMTDRVAVFHHGRITGVLETAKTNQEEIMRYASGYSRTSGADAGARSKHG